jgi:thiamine biosynthesis lipoprotein
MVLEPGPAFVGHALGSHLRLFIRPPAGLDEGAVAGSAASAWAAVEAEFEAVDLALSRFRRDSELTALNRMAGTDRVVEVSWRLRTAVATMHRATCMTDGRFDPSVLGALEAIGEHGADVPAPRDDDEDKPTAWPRGTSVAALELPRPIRTPLQPLDTGGIGKGLALRWAARRALERMPIGTALLLDAGGDVLAAGRNADNAWQVGVEDPLAQGADDDPIAVVAVADGAIATSSVRVRNWLGPDGRPVHHLIDPVTRAPARTGLLAVTVAGPDPAWAEVWTKALFLTGNQGIRDEARARGLAAWWIDADGRLGMTPAARARSTWVAEARLA